MKIIFNRPKSEKNALERGLPLTDEDGEVRELKKKDLKSFNPSYFVSLLEIIEVDFAEDFIHFWYTTRSH